MRMASRPSTTPSRLEANPGESLTTIGSLPSARANATARSTLAAAARGCRTISTSFIAWTGLKKCSPTTRPGSCTAPAMAATESEEVLVASSAPAGAVRSSSANNRCLTPRSSTTASITTSASPTARAGSRSARNRVAAAVTSASCSLPRFTAPVNKSPIRRMAGGRASGRLSVRTTVHPASVATYAMPWPIVPAPTTTTRDPVTRTVCPRSGAPCRVHWCRDRPRRGRAGDACRRARSPSRHRCRSRRRGASRPAGHQ